MSLVGDKMRRLNQKGFTLIEVLAVIVIIALLGVIAVPGVLNTINNSKKSSYNIMVDDIKTAGTELFEELEIVGNDLKQYTEAGVSDQKIDIESKELDGKLVKEISTNLQTLVSNGFLKGSSNNKETSTNKNAKILLNPITNKDIGQCKLIIRKVIDDSTKVVYEFYDDSKTSGCPTTSEYQ